MTELTAQGIFDDSVRRLAGMKCRAAAKNDKCMYRSPNGPCLIGALLTDDEARPDGIPLDDMPSSSVGSLDNTGLLPHRLIPHVNLLISLQHTHDTKANWLGGGGGPANPDKMAVELRLIAEDFSLSDAVICEVWPQL